MKICFYNDFDFYEKRINDTTSSSSSAINLDQTKTNTVAQVTHSYARRLLALGRKLRFKLHGLINQFNEDDFLFQYKFLLKGL